MNTSPNKTELASHRRHLATGRKARWGNRLLALICGFTLVSGAALLLNSCTLLADLAPVHEDTSKVQDWMVLPVFFATTRKHSASSGVNFGEEKADEGGLKFGVKNVIVPAPTKVRVSDETIEKMGWKRIHLEHPLKDGEKPPIPDKLAVADREFTVKEVVEQFDDYQDTSGNDKVVFFVHGCCATFEASLERAAKIESHMQKPLVVFDWASPKGFTKYLQNETMASQSYDDFYDFLNAVEEHLKAAETILLGHSMGTRFLEDALLRRSEKARLKLPYDKYAATILCQPDSDARCFIRHNDQINGQAEKTQIFFNTTDGRLEASATAHGGFERLGRPGPLLGELCKIKNQSMIDITACAMGHEIPFWVLADLTNGVDTKEQGLACVEEGVNHIVLKKVQSK